MKSHWILPLVLLIANCASNGIRMPRATHNQSLATDILRDKVVSEIATSENKHKGSCSTPVVQRVILKSSARGASGQIIAAREDWIVNRCGQDVIYQVDYYGPIGEHTNIHVKMMDMRSSGCRPY